MTIKPGSGFDSNLTVIGFFLQLTNYQIRIPSIIIANLHAKKIGISVCINGHLKFTLHLHCM
jgi:hypothetical protein